MTAIKHYIIVKHRFLIVAIVIAIIVRLWWMFSFQPEIASDARWYYQKACQMANGEGYHDEGIPTAFYPVGYPAFLALFFKLFNSQVLIARILNLLLYVAFLIVFFALLQKFKIQVKVIGLALILLAFYPNHVSYVNLLYSENLFLFVFFLALLFYFHKKKKVLFIIFSGICFGIAVLIRPAVLLIPFLLVFMPDFKAFAKIRIKNTIVLYVLIFLVVIPWSIRNYKVLGSFVWVSSTSGYDLLIGNHPEATGNFHINEPLLKSIPDSLDEVQYDKITKQMALKYMIKNPVETILRVPLKIFYFLWPPSEGIGWNTKGVAVEQMKVLKGISFLNNLIFILTLFVIIISAIFTKPDKYFSRLFLLIASYYLFVSIIFFGESRFHLHIIPFGAVLFALAIEKIKEYIRNKLIFF